MVTLLFILIFFPLFYVVESNLKNKCSFSCGFYSPELPLCFVVRVECVRVCILNCSMKRSVYMSVVQVQICLRANRKHALTLIREGGTHTTRQGKEKSLFKALLLQTYYFTSSFVKGTKIQLKDSSCAVGSATRSHLTWVHRASLITSESKMHPVPHSLWNTVEKQRSDNLSPQVEVQVIGSARLWAIWFL